MTRINRSSIIATGAALLTTTGIIVGSLVPLNASAQSSPPAIAPTGSGDTSVTFTVDQARNAFANTGLQVEQPNAWSWTSPSVTSFQVHDGSRALMVLVYPSAAAANAARHQAEANDALQGNSAGFGSPHLVDGYGPSTWMDNIALVQSTTDTLNRQFQAQADLANGVTSDATRMAATEMARAVDVDFQLALEPPATNL
jgi:hypothetical protein